jgi:hypothetical protein
MCPSSQSWPLKSNRDTEQNTGRRFTVVVVRDRAPDEPLHQVASANSNDRRSHGFGQPRPRRWPEPFFLLIYV